MSHENNDFLGADLYKDISGSIASSLNSILGSRRNSIVVQGITNIKSSKLTSTDFVTCFVVVFIIEFQLA